MKYYYGNTYKEAVSNPPIEIRSTKRLKSFEDVYNLVIPVNESDE